MLLFYYIYAIIIALPLFIASTILCCVSIIICAPIGLGPACANYAVNAWSWFTCYVFLVRVKVEGRENVDKRNSYVFVANHQGAFDIFAIGGFLGHHFRWMMKKSLRKIFLVGYASDRAGYIFVDRSSPSAIRRTIADAQQRLRDGASLVVFPEGTRTPDGTLKPFKRGAYQLALEFKLPLVPITIDGSYKVMSRNSIFPRPGVIKLTIHKPIPAPENETERAEVMDITRQAIASALPQ